MSLKVVGWVLSLLPALHLHGDERGERVKAVLRDHEDERRMLEKERQDFLADLKAVDDLIEGRGADDRP